MKLRLVDRQKDNSRFYVDQSSLRAMPDNKARPRTVTFSPVVGPSDAIEVHIYFEFDCRDEKARILGGNTYDIDGEHLNKISGPFKWEYYVPNSIGFSMLLTACNKSE